LICLAPVGSTSLLWNVASIPKSALLSILLFAISFGHCNTIRQGGFGLSLPLFCRFFMTFGYFMKFAGANSIGFGLSLTTGLSRKLCGLIAHRRRFILEPGNQAGMIACGKHIGPHLVPCLPRFITSCGLFVSQKIANRDIVLVKTQHDKLL
ncbi:MAG TPA: hypothetical protein VGD41_09370, partial [Pyrinomonadaceae bacterium]